MLVNVSFYSILFILLNGSSDSNVNNVLFDEYEMNSANIYEFSGFQLISQTLESILPKVPIEIICDYAHENHFELYDKVMKKLSLYLKTTININFHDSNFLKNIFRLCSTIVQISKVDSSFSYDLIRLFLKWMIYTRGTILNKEKLQELNEIVHPILSIMSQIEGIEAFQYISAFNSFSLLNFNDDFINDDGNNQNSQNDDIKYLQQLMNHEFFERSDIFHLFISIIEDFYYKGFSCQALEKKYFKGNFDRDIVLKSMIYFYDPAGIIKKCFQKRSLALIVVTFEDVNVISTSVNISEIFNFNINFISNTLINFLLVNGLCFKISNSNDLYMLLEKLCDIELLNKKLIRRIAGFPYKWNIRKFKNYLLSGSKIYGSLYKRIRDVLL